MSSVEELTKATKSLSSISYDPPICDYVFVKGLKKGQMCPDIGRYNGRCCKHKRKEAKVEGGQDLKDLAEKKTKSRAKAKANTDKLRDDEIFNENVREDKAEEPKERSSIWNFTVNTNTDYDKMTADDKRKFKKFMSMVFDPDNIFDFITDLEALDDSKQNVDNVEIDYYFENSSKNLLHAHGVIKIMHHGFLKLKLNEIRSMAKIVFGKAIHLDAPVSSNHQEVWQNYIAKAGIAGKLEF